MIPDRVFVTGTDTDVGKTVVCAALCAAFGHDYWKPVQSGLHGPTDSNTVAKLTGLARVRTWPEAWRLQRAASPHAAAADEGLTLDVTRLHLPPAPRLVVEGAGGWMVPYSTQPPRFTADVVRQLDLPVLVVARTGLGTLNHTLLTLRALREDGVEVLGLVLCGAPHPENARDLALLGHVRVLATLPRVGDVARDFDQLVQAVRG